MSEEDVRNAAERLRKLLRAAQYPQLSALLLEAGNVSDLLRILHFVLLNSSRAVAKFLVEKGYDLNGKTDARFVESAFRLLRDEFRCFPSLSVTQFLSKKFVARRLAIVANAAAAVAHKRQELQRLKRREEAVWSQPQEGIKREIKPQVENHVLPTPMANHAASILQHLKVTEDGTPVFNGVKQDRDSVTPPPAPSSTGRRVDGRASRVQFASDSGWTASEKSYAVDDGVRTDSAPTPYSTSDLETAVGDLSRQLSEMSSALMSKMSSVENRLGRLENQMHGVVENQRELVREFNLIMMSKTTDAKDDALPRRVDTSDRGLDAESPCAWPPQPAVFERY